MLAADVQQFFCFEVLGEMLDRLTTSANIIGSAHAQFAKERQNSMHRIVEENSMHCTV